MITICGITLNVTGVLNVVSIFLCAVLLAYGLYLDWSNRK